VLARSLSAFEQLECVGAGQVVKDFQRGGEEVAQPRAQPNQVPRRFQIKV
jgi:hypothetical protein